MDERANAGRCRRAYPGRCHRPRPGWRTRRCGWPAGLADRRRSPGRSLRRDTSSRSSPATSTGPHWASSLARSQPRTGWLNPASHTPAPHPPRPRPQLLIRPAPIPAPHPSARPHWPSPARLARPACGCRCGGCTCPARASAAADRPPPAGPGLTGPGHRHPVRDRVGWPPRCAPAWPATSCPWPPRSPRSACRWTSAPAAKPSPSTCAAPSRCATRTALPRLRPARQRLRRAPPGTPLGRRRHRPTQPGPAMPVPPPHRHPPLGLDPDASTPTAPRPPPAPTVAASTTAIAHPAGPRRPARSHCAAPCDCRVPARHAYPRGRGPAGLARTASNSGGCRWAVTTVRRPARLQATQNVGGQAYRHTWHEVCPGSGGRANRRE